MPLDLLARVVGGHGHDHERREHETHQHDQHAADTKGAAADSRGEVGAEDRAEEDRDRVPEREGQDELHDTALAPEHADAHERTGDEDPDAEKHGSGHLLSRANTLRQQRVVRTEEEHASCDDVEERSDHLADLPVQEPPRTQEDPQEDVDYAHRQVTKNEACDEVPERNRQLNSS